MPKKLRPIAIALFLTATVAHAGEQEDLVKRAFEALTQSSRALERGDHQRATVLVANLQRTASKLRLSAANFQEQAKGAERRAQDQLLENRTRIEQTVQEERDAKKKEDAVHIPMAKLDSDRHALYRRVQELQRELEWITSRAAKWEWCKAHFWEMGSRECFRLMNMNLFGDRSRIANDLMDAERKYGELNNQLGILNQELERNGQELNRLANRIRDLQNERPELEKREGFLRDAVVSLMDAAKFWADTVVLIQSKMTSIDTLQEGLMVLARRADSKTKGPVFNSYDKTEIRSLRDSLFQFARTIDNHTNILLSPK